MNGQTVRAYWSLVDAYVSAVTYCTDAVTRCLLCNALAPTARPLDNSSKTKPCQFSSVTSLCTHLQPYMV